MKRLNFILMVLLGFASLQGCGSHVASETEFTYQKKGYIWNADETPAALTLTSQPPAASREHHESLSFTVTGYYDHVECSLDEKTAVDCSSPFEMKDLQEGIHQLRVQVLDAQGYVLDEKSVKWVTDWTPPQGPFNLFISGNFSEPMLFRDGVHIEVRSQVEDQLKIACKVNDEPINTRCSWDPQTFILKFDSELENLPHYDLQVFAADHAGNIGSQFLMRLQR